MTDERRIKTHLIVTDIHEEYLIKYFTRLIDTKPLLKNNLPVFIIIGNNCRVEMNTANMRELENCAKRLTNPRGRSAITTDKARIYIKEIDGKETYVALIIHNHIKTYAPMSDKVGYRDVV